MLKKIVNAYIVPAIAAPLITLISKSLRLVKVDGKNIEDSLHWYGPVVLMAWHDRLFYLPYYFAKEKKRIKVLTSPSADGEMVAKTVRLLGYQVLRGSSFKKAISALRDLKRSVDDGYTVGLTGDGSRGPRHEMQAGALMVSKLTGAPVLPVTVSFSSYWRFETWDRFLIPKPFAKVYLSFDNPLLCPRKASAAEIETLRKKLDHDHNALSDMADRYFDNDA